MKTQSLGLALVFGLAATVLACQDGGVVAPDDIQPQFAKPTCPGHPSCKPDDPDPGGEEGTVLVLRGGMHSDETYSGEGDPAYPPDANILVDNRNKFVGETSQTDRVHGLTPALNVTSCTFDLPADFRDPELLNEEETYLETDYLNVHRYATVVVLWDKAPDATIKFWGNIPIPGEDDTMIPEIHLLAGPDAVRDQNADNTQVSFTIETILVKFGTKMGGGSVTCTDLPAQEVTATFYPL